jgi:hypothetical protein
MNDQDLHAVIRRAREGEAHVALRRGFELGDVEMLLSLIDDSLSAVARNDDADLHACLGLMARVAARIRRA